MALPTKCAFTKEYKKVPSAEGAFSYFNDFTQYLRNSSTEGVFPSGAIFFHRCLTIGSEDAIAWRIASAICRSASATVM